MANTPITGVPLPAAGATDQVPADLMTAFSNAETMFIGRFATAADRDGKITAPVGGQVAWLISPGKFVYFDALLAAWADFMNPTAFDSWTPTITGPNGVVFTLGGGSAQTGRFRLTGKRVEFQCEWSFGTQVVGPGGILAFLLPPGLSPSAAVIIQTGPISLYVPSTDEYYSGFWRIYQGNTNALMFFPKDRTTSAMWFFRESTDGVASGTGVPNIPTNYPIQPNGILTASGEYEIA